MQLKYLYTYLLVCLSTFVQNKAFQSQTLFKNIIYQPHLSVCSVIVKILDLS